MPNPIAHPAASIPFARFGLVFSALVIGSISPDFGYLVLHVNYFASRTSPFFMNTALGLLLFDVPIALVLLWLFHVVVKWPLLSLLPESLQRRLFKHAQGFTFRPLKRFALILLSLLVGSLTHVVWDSFTHKSGWTVKHFPFLTISINGTPLYTILQNLGTLIGISVLIYWSFRWLQAAPQSDQLPARFPVKVRIIFFGLTIASLVLVEGPIIYSRVLTGSPLVGQHFLMDNITVLPVLIVSFLVGTYCGAWIITFNKKMRRMNVSK